METLPSRPAAAMQVRPLPGGRGLALIGELDLSTVDAVRSWFDDVGRPGADIRLDLAELEFMDSAGVNLLVDVLRGIGTTGRLTLSRPTTVVVRLLRVCGLDARPNVVIED